MPQGTHWLSGQFLLGRVQGCFPGDCVVDQIWEPPVSRLPSALSSVSTLNCFMFGDRKMMSRVSKTRDRRFCLPLYSQTPKPVCVPWDVALPVRVLGSTLGSPSLLLKSSTDCVAPALPGRRQGRAGDGAGTSLRKARHGSATVPHGPPSRQ